MSNRNRRTWVWAENTVTHASHLWGILSSVTCSQLWLLGITLSETETRVLVTAMKDQVEAVRLSGVTLDMEEVCLYDGRGRCRDLQLDGDTKAMWGERIRGWSARVGWGGLCHLTMILDWSRSKWINQQ